LVKRKRNENRLAIKKKKSTVTNYEVGEFQDLGESRQKTNRRIFTCSKKKRNRYTSRHRQSQEAKNRKVRSSAPQTAKAGQTNIALKKTQRGGGVDIWCGEDPLGKKDRGPDQAGGKKER